MRARMPQFSAAAMEENGQLLALLQNLAAEKGATCGQIELAWMLCKKPYIVPIPGTRKYSRLAENAGAADIALTSEEVAAIDARLETIPMSTVFGVIQNQL